MLPHLALLEDLTLLDFEESALAQLDRFQQVSRLTLYGSSLAISNVDRSKFVLLDDTPIARNVNRALVGEMKQSKHSKHLLFLSSASSSSSSYASFTPSMTSSNHIARKSQLSDLTIDVNDTWTNQTFYNAICSDSSNVNATGLIVRSTPTNLLWFKIPSCIESWTQLQTLRCYFCQFPNMTALPSSLKQFSFTNTKDSWTQSITGRVTSDSPFANYFDWNWINNLPSLTDVFIPFSIQGTLPNELTHSSLGYLGLYGAPGNRMTGTIAPDFFVRFPSLSLVNLHYNEFTGTIPFLGIQNLKRFQAPYNQFTHWPSFVSNTSIGFGPPNNLITIELTSNRLVEIPSYENLTNLPSLSSLYIDSNSNLSGTLPNIFNQTIPRTSSNGITAFVASFCNFSGPLPEIPQNQIAAYQTTSTTTSLALNNNQFTGTIPTSWSNAIFRDLSLAGNPGLTGTIAQIDPLTGALSSPLAKEIGWLSLDSDGIVGPMFNITAMPSLESLTLRSKNVDFCGTARIVVASNASAEGTLLFPSGSTSLSKCILLDTNAANCAWAFPPVCSVSAPFPIQPFVPVLSSVIVTCTLPSPGPSFVCIDGAWTSYSSINQSTITVSSPTIINGNLTTSTIIISDLGASINVTGCINASIVTIVLTDADIALLESKHGKTLTRQLLTQPSSCPTLVLESVNVNNDGVHSCKKIKTSQVENSSGLVATFTLDSSRCHVWWIVLVSLICAVIVLAAVLVVVYFIVTQMKLKNAHSKLTNNAQQ